jgi:thiol-disulfide isomerase/thioredoxin
MKRLLFAGFLAFSMFAFVGCEEDNVPGENRGDWTGDLNPAQVQRALVWETTGTWCGYCPNGAEMLTMAEAAYGDLIIPMVYHTGDPLQTPTGSTMSANFPTSGVPNFYVNWQDVGQSIDGPIANALAETAKVGVGHEWQANGNKFTINTKIQVYEPLDGVIMVGTYLVSGDLPASGQLTQSDFTDRLEDRAANGTTSSYWKVNAAEVAPGNFLIKQNTIYQHKSTFVTAGGDNPWGEQVLSMQMFPGDIHEKTFELTAPSWVEMDGAKIATIVWKKQGDSYFFINGYMK